MRTLKKLRMMTVSVFALSMVAWLSASANSTGSSTWRDSPTGAVWGDDANWIGGMPGATEQARFTATQTTTSDVTVNTDETFRETLVQQSHTFNGTGSLTMEYAPDVNERILENHYSSGSPTTTYNIDVMMRSTTASSASLGAIYNTGTLTFNSALVLTNTVNLDATSRVKMDAIGTTYINNNFYHGAGIRLTGGTVVIGGSGISSAESSTVMTLLGGELQLNRAGALDVAKLTPEGTEISLGANNALLSGTDLNFIGGVLLAQGYDQEFGWLDVGTGAKETVFDMGTSDSIWTFEDSSAQVWGAGTLAITNAGGATIRFAGTGLTETQIGQITIDGVSLTVGDTWTDGTYLYVTLLVGSSSLYTAWVAGYDLSGGAADLGADPDLDNMDNLLEYALGGNPTNSDASAILPNFMLVDGGGTNWLEYTYQRRLDAIARGLTYEVLRNDSLLIGSWTNSGISEASAVVDAEFEAVTNRISTAIENAQFMKLNVEFQ